MMYILPSILKNYEAEARDTKLGPEEITRDIPGVGDDALKDWMREVSSVSGQRYVPGIFW